MIEEHASPKSVRYAVHILGANETFLCRAGEEILKAMVQLGCRGIPSGCHGGGCGVCKVKVIEGRVQAQHMSRDKVSVEEERQGYVLACKAMPLSPLRIEVVGQMKKSIERRYGFV